MLSLSEYIQQFLEYLEVEKNVSKLTIRNYRHYLKRFEAFLKADSPTLARPDHLNYEIVRRYRLFLSRFVDQYGITLKRVTQNYHLIALRSFLKYMIKRDVVTLNPEKIDLPKTESRSLKFLGRDEVERLLNMPEISTPQGMRDKAIMEVLFSTGLRVSELVRLNRNSVNLESKEFGVIGKGGRARVVFLSDAAASWIERYIKERDDDYKPLFIRYSGVKKEPDPNGEVFRLTSRSVQRIVEKYVRKAHLAIKITPHGLRHSFATDLLSAGADIRAIQEMLGHKNISTTQIYTHVTNPQLKKIHSEFHRKA